MVDIENMNQEEWEPLINRIILKHVDPKETLVFLFGSRARGGFHRAADYDVGLYNTKKIPLATIAKIKDELEDHPIPVDVDIVDFSSVPEEFKRLALKEVKIWNQPKKNLKLTSSSSKKPLER
ncbi:MAG: nucleotidyltransferase domain-containing protein [Elusimicrobia bacterium]|nr:nucleotidyltransferase domain-containing protein [Candidatus Obscuribacterium magneticum]